MLLQTRKEKLISWLVTKIIKTWITRNYSRLCLIWSTCSRRFGRVTANRDSVWRVSLQAGTHSRTNWVEFVVQNCRSSWPIVKWEHLVDDNCRMKPRPKRNRQTMWQKQILAAKQNFVLSSMNEARFESSINNGILEIKLPSLSCFDYHCKI